MIQIIKGVYGYVDEKTGCVHPKTAKDKPFKTDPEKEARLVRLGVAVYVEGQPSASAEDTPETDEAEAVEPSASLEDMTANELRELGREYGLTFKGGTKKVEMVEAIKTAQAEATEEEAMPSFDAVDAVE